MAEAAKWLTPLNRFAAEWLKPLNADATVYLG